MNLPWIHWLNRSTAWHVYNEFPTSTSLLSQLSVPVVTFYPDPILMPSIHNRYRQIPYLDWLSHPNVGWLYVLDDPSVTLTQGHGCDIDKQKFACLQGKVKTTQPITAKLSSDIPLVMIITWLDFWGNLLETIILPNFLRKFWMCFFKVKHSRTYLRNDWSD